MEALKAAKEEIQRRKAANYSYLFLADRPGAISDKNNCVVHPVRQTWVKNLERDEETALEFLAANPNPEYPYRLGFARKARGAVDTVILPGARQEMSAAEVEELETETEESVPMSENIRGYDQALKDQALIEKLKFEIKLRDRKIEELEAEIEALEDVVNDQETTQMADGTISLINQLAPLLPALADKYFSLQEQKIAAMRGQYAPQQRPQAPRQQPQPQQEENQTTIFEDYGI